MKITDSIITVERSGVLTFRVFGRISDMAAGTKLRKMAEADGAILGDILSPITRTYRDATLVGVSAMFYAYEITV